MSGRYNWDSASHQRLYDDIHGLGYLFHSNGAGVSGAHGAQEGWAELASVMARARERTEAALANAGAVWEGGAADAMRSGVTPLAQWAADANTASTASQQSTDSHVYAYSSAKNRMPEPVRVTSTANTDGLGIPAMYTHLLGGQTDQDKQEAAAQEAKAEAVRIMSGYEIDSTSAQARVGQFVPPPSVTVNVPPPQPKTSDGISVGVREWPGTGRIDNSSGPTHHDTAQDTVESGHAPGATPPPGGSTPLPGDNPSSPGTTTPSVAAPVPPSVNPVVPGGLDQYRPGTTMVPPGVSAIGNLGELASGGGRGQGGRGFGAGFGEGGTAGRGAGGPGAGGGARGLAAPVNEPVAGRAGGVGVAGARGAGGMGGGMAPAGGRSDGDEDKEHTAAEYLRDFHDDFWDDSPPVAPAVIGEDED